MSSRILLASVAIIMLGILTVASAYYYYTHLSSGASPSPSASPTPAPASAPSAITTDLNWGGYAVASDFNNPQPVISEVSGSWTVPEVSISQNDRFSAIWIGIGGTFGTSLIQVGTEQDCINGAVSYSAWYELLPENSITITTMEISPGDTISASITLADPTANVWTISISDLSNAQSFSQDLPYDASRLSAEWVVERPLVNNVLSQLADFSLITFSKCNVKLDGKTENLNVVPSLKIVLVNKQRMQLVNVSNLGGGGSTFTIQYGLAQ